MAEEGKYIPVKHSQPVHKRMNKFQYNTKQPPNGPMKNEKKAESEMKI